MKKVTIPCQRGSVIPCNSWMGLAKSIKELYGQPLHYLTNILLKQWDQARFETGEEFQPLDTIIHPVKAEATIWFVEEVHRRTASYHQISKLWLRDPIYRAFVDPIFPSLEHWLFLCRRQCSNLGWELGLCSEVFPIFMWIYGPIWCRRNCSSGRFQTTSLNYERI